MLNGNPNPAMSVDESMSAPDVSVNGPRNAAPPPRPAPPAAFSVAAIQDFAELEKYTSAWDDLAAAAVEPNVFYESWMLLPALRAYGAGKPLTVLLVFSHGARGSRGEPLLCGLFPLERRGRFGGIPIRAPRLWRHVHCYLTVPLVRAGFGPECLQAVFDWLAKDRRGGSLLECEEITGDGPFYHLLLDYLEAGGRAWAVESAHTRALLRQGDGGGYLEAVLSGEKRKKLRRAEERLAETGPVQYVELAEDGDVEAWLTDFLRLEASGWKGREGTALDCNGVDRDFFLTAARGAFQRRRLSMLALHVGGRPVAQLCNFLAAHGAFAFKVAYDADYARFSPGVLLELEGVRRMHARPAIRWMDSCSPPGPSLTKTLWMHRRIIQTILVETGRRPGRLVLAALPLLRWLRRGAGAWFRRHRTRAQAPGGRS
jgi:CelD/BcsL family acetyltransferase involved in cellulose biosynthesis